MMTACLQQIRGAALEHLWALFSILVANGLTLNLEKCVFAFTERDFLSRRLSTGGEASPGQSPDDIGFFPTPLTARHFNGS